MGAKPYLYTVRNNFKWRDLHTGRLFATRISDLHPTGQRTPPGRPPQLEWYIAYICRARDLHLAQLALALSKYHYSSLTRCTIYRSCMIHVTTVNPRLIYSTDDGYAPHAIKKSVTASDARLYLQLRPCTGIRNTIYCSTSGKVGGGSNLLPGPTTQVLHHAGGGTLDVPLLQGCLCLRNSRGGKGDFSHQGRAEWGRGGRGDSFTCSRV